MTLVAEHFGLVCTVEPSADAVTLADVKDWLKVEETADDALIAGLIRQTTKAFEHLTRLALVTQTWRLSLDAFPPAEIEVPRPPLQSVTSIQYVDTAGTLQTLSAALYEVDTDATPGRIFPAYGTDWPSTRESPRAVRVTFVAGYGASTDLVPQDMRTAIAQAVAYQYDNRGDQILDEEFPARLFRKFWQGI